MENERKKHFAWQPEMKVFAAVEDKVGDAGIIRVFMG